MKSDELLWGHADLEFYPDAIDTLIQLKARKITRIVTNGLRKDYEQILRRLDAMKYFDALVSIDTRKRAKPDKKILIRGVTQLQVKSEETIFVGDSMKHDYEGAKKQD